MSELHVRPEPDGMLIRGHMDDQGAMLLLYRFLWGVWFFWIALLLHEIYPDKRFSVLLAALSVIPGLFILYPSLKKIRRLPVRLFDRVRNAEVVQPDDTAEGTTVLTPQPLLAELSEEYDDKSGIRLSVVGGVTYRNTVISEDIQVTGDMTGKGNVIIEGQVTGNITGSHQVRVECGGRVKGGIEARHIIVNGTTEGELCAETITLQCEGKIQGDIYTDELVIEKGGIFTGLSQAKKPGTVLPEPDNRGRLNATGHGRFAGKKPDTVQVKGEES